MTKKKASSNIIPVPATNFLNLGNAPYQIVSSAIAPPPYEDSGVKYQGYYKVKLNDNSYALKKQDRFFFFRQATGGGNTDYFATTRQRRLYITDINIQFNITTYNSLNSVNLSPVTADHTGTGSTMLNIGLWGNAGAVNVHFEVPFVIDLITSNDILTDLRILITNNAPTGTDRIYLTISGFYEYP